MSGMRAYAGRSTNDGHQNVMPKTERIQHILRDRADDHVVRMRMKRQLTRLKLPSVGTVQRVFRQSIRKPLTPDRGSAIAGGKMDRSRTSSQSGIECMV